MGEFVRLFAGFLAAMIRSREGLQAENLALRHQLCVYQRSVKRPKVRPVDRILWSFLAGRPPVADEVKELIRTMSSMNPTWGSPRIVGELAKLGITVTKSTVDKYRVCVRNPPSPTWRAFLRNHAKDIVSIDFMVVPTVRFQVLYVLLFLSVERRRIIHFGVTAHPAAAWAAQQVFEAFPWNTSPKYLLRDRDKIYGDWFRRRVKNMDIEEVLTAPHSPWQNPYSE